MKSSDQHDKMILSAGCVQSNKKMCFARKAKIKSEVFTKLQTGPVQVGKVPAYLFRDHGGSFCTDIKIFQIFLKRSTYYFLLESASLKQFLIDLSMQENVLISNVIWNN